MVANPNSFTDAVSAAKREEYNDQMVSGTAPWLKQQQAQTQAIQEGISHSSTAQVSLNALSSPVTPARPGLEGELLKQMKDLMITKQQMLNSLREEIRGKNNWPCRNQSSNYRAPFRQNQNISGPTSNRAPQKVTRA